MLSSISRSVLRRSLALQRVAVVRPTAATANTTVRGMAEMPVPQSQKAVLFEGHPTNEGWEWTVAWWYTTSFILLVGILGFAPKTEITAWAKQEAAARLKMKEQGVEEFVFGTHYKDLTVSQAKTAWDNFSTKALRMNDDDDDDEDEEDEDEEDDDDDE